MAIRRRANVVKSIGGKVIELIFGSIIADMVRAGGWWVGRAMIELARWEVEERWVTARGSAHVMYAFLHVNMPQHPLPSTLHTVGVSGVMGVCELVTTKPRGFPILTIHQHEVKDKVQTGFFPRFNPNFLV
jgi:hypothetical protein